MATTENHTSNPHRSHLGAWSVALLAGSVGVTAIVVSIAVARATGSRSITNPQILSGVIVCVGVWVVTAMVALAARIEAKIEEARDWVLGEITEYGHRERSEGYTAGYTAAATGIRVNGGTSNGLHPVR